MRVRKIGVLLGLLVGVGASALHATCQVCTYHNMINGYFGWCSPAKDGDNGVTQCTDENSMDGPSCFEGGDFCTVIDVHGGGGSGGVGGGSGGGEGCGFNPGGCPAACFGCGGKAQ